MHEKQEESSHGDIQFFTCIEFEAESHDRNADQYPSMPLVSRERIAFPEHHGGCLRAVPVPGDV